MSDLETFRAETRAWLEENCPADMRDGAKDEASSCWGGRKWEFTSEGQKIWLERMGARGWTVPTWPKEYGGGGLNKAEAAVLQEEMDAIGARKPHDNFGITMLGPAMLHFGSEEQKREHLPKIARGEIRWCQGYSEPGAGSDLASLRTSADDGGDHYIVNGQKIWTSYADRADWIFCLVRTDKDAPKHKGISFILFDMESEGVSTKPIKLISGSSPFCETFFDNVKVPKQNLVHEENRGWDVAKYLLTHEREMIGALFGSMGGPALGSLAVEELGTDEMGRVDDPLLRSKLVQAEIDSLAFSALLESVEAKNGAGESLGATSSVLKYYGTELNKRRHELMMEVGGSEAMEVGQRSSDWLRTKGNSIEGGTSEIQLQIIAKHILQMPGA
ncbi:acyl-CoA dehydrogenase family protein [Pseudahrensia aquimaris]|uniref:Acyl-CoA dehydrogenase family protein n=1 Tax=Pseudahrensia aquimaris TaxID=744461 RepID=A0ABW3FH39_9HYPH